MPAAVHVLTGPPGAGKTARLLARFRALQEKSFGSALWIVPTRRAADALRPHLTGFPLHLYPFQDFVEEIIRVNDPRARPLSDLQRRLVADELVADLNTRKKLSHFERIIDTRGFAEAIFALLAELKENEIWPIHLARALARRGGKGRNERIHPKDRQCVRIYARYQQQLIRHHLYDLEGRFWYARDLLARGMKRPFEGIRAVFVDGFTSFTRTQHEILQAMAGRLSELWIALPDEGNNDRVELFARSRVTLEKLSVLKPHVEPREAGFFATDRDAKPAVRTREKLPAGLIHLEWQLFRPLRAVTPSSDADGIHLIEAPGVIGEARLVAREIKQRLLDGVPARDILVTLRDVPSSADLLHEVFAEYGIPVDIEGAEPLQRNPAVGTLLRALRLPEDGWPFAGVTALLRSSYLQPDWPETRSNRDIAQHAEALLRLLGHPRGRETYLRAVDQWAEAPEAGLEDEEADEPRRRRTHELAKRCRPFLHRFFRSWDDAPGKAALAEQVVWLRQFAADLGVVRAAASRQRDQAALGRLFDELDRWIDLEGKLFGQRLRDRGQFLRLLAVVCGGVGLPRTPRGPGRVRVLSAHLARDIPVPYLFVMGLGERSFPDLSAAEPFFDEADRQSFRQAGLDMPRIAERMPDEMLLFYRLVTGARRQLTLSYPAVDEKGQSLLPSSFLSALLECFVPGSVKRTERRMLIQEYDRQTPFSAAEYRVQTAGTNPPARSSGLADDLAGNLAAAAKMARKRMKDADFGPFDGWLRASTVRAELEKQFGPKHVFSPTALETYIACPFQFFLRNVLRLEPLEEPREEIEQTRRGQAFHRALSRLHRQLHDRGIHRPGEEVTAALLDQLASAVKEHAERAPSQASRVLWELEGERLKRAGARYRGHWQNFVEPWAEHGVAPRPEHFEAGFGLRDTAVGPLVVSLDGIEARIGGRIDRVDVAELEDGLGFWIVDYKTGSASHYSAGDLLQFRRLQLPLYALAVEDTLLRGKHARPLGLAYWLVTESGPKPVLPAGKLLTSWLTETARWEEMREQLRKWVVTLVSHIRGGDFALKPRSVRCTDTCDFSQVCRISQSRHAVETKTWSLELPIVSGDASEKG